MARKATTLYANYVNLNFNPLEATNWSITIQSTDGCKELKKYMGEEAAIGENFISVKFTPEEMNIFDNNELVKIQLKAEVNGDTGATDITQDYISEILDTKPFSEVLL